MELCQLEFVEPRVKVHILDEGYTWVPKTRDFIKDLKEEISGNKKFWDLEVFLKPHLVRLCSKR